MTDRYDELRAAAEAATPGPWVAYNRNMSGEDGDVLGWDFEDGQGPPEPMRGVLMGRDMRFVVLARRDVPALLSERDALAERVRVLEGVLRVIAGLGGDHAERIARSALSPSPLVEGGR
jgi:hypothetical protein